MKVTVYNWPLWFTAAGRREAVLAWREGLRVRDALPAEMLEMPGLWVSVMGREAHLDDPLGPGDSVHYGVRPHGPFAAPVAAGFIGPPAQIGFWQTAFGGFLASTLASIGVSLVIGLLLGHARGPRKRNDGESSTYGFGGLANDRLEGQPRQVVYGYTRVAPQILDEFTETVGIPSETTLYVLAGLGEGPLEAIGSSTSDTAPAFPLKSDDPLYPLPTGIQLNGNALENFNGIEAHIRMGSNAQKWIPGFNSTVTAYDIGSELAQEETSPSSGTLGLANDLLVPALNMTSATTDYNSDDAAAQAVWTEYGVAQDTSASGDSISALIDFPAGLYGISATTGNLRDAAFMVLMRYIELDGGGLPITTGGDNGDGYVYVPPTPILVARQQGRFQREYSTVLYDPQTWVAPTRGYMLDCSGGTGRYAATAVATAMNGIPSTWLAGGSGLILPGFAIEGWFKMTGETFSIDAANQVKYLFSWGDGVVSGGFECVLENYLGTGVGAGSYRYKASIRNAQGTSLCPNVPVPYNAGFIPRIATEWSHVVFNYTRQSSGNKLVEIYWNGALLSSRLLVSSPNIFGSTAAMKFFRNRTNTTTTRGQADEMRIHERALTASEVLQSYASGRGSYGSSAQETIVDGWHCDLATNPGTDTVTVGYANSNQLTAAGGGIVGVAAGAGHVFTASSGTTRRMKVRVEMLRTNYESDSQYVQEDATWQALYVKLDVKLAYPNTPILGMKIKASEQLNSSTPTITALCKGRQCPVYDGSAITHQWTRNPAWIACDILTNKRYGAGASFSEDDIDWVSAKEWADYCDGLIYDGSGNILDIHSVSSLDIADLRYQQSSFSGFGGIDVIFRAGVTPPVRWVVGAYVGFAGLPQNVFILVDINYTNTDVPGGWEIGSMSYNNGTDIWTVSLRYDRATYGDPWSDSALYSTEINPTAVTGTAELREPRFQFDGVMDTFRSVWDTLLEVCSVGRAIAIQEGKRIRFKHERPRDPVAVIGHAQITPGSFEMEYVDRIDIANSLTIEFTDRDQNFSRAIVNVDDPRLETTFRTEDLRRENISLVGITRRSQAIRDALYRLNVNRLIKKSGSFESGLEALPLEPGDVFVLSHDVVPWGKSGRIASAGANTVLLDRAVTLAPATTYYIRARMNTLGQTGSGSTVSDYMEVVTVASAAGTYNAGDSISVSAWTTVPAKDDPYVLYSASEQFLAQVTSTSLEPDLKRKINWVQYDANIYDVDRLTTDLPSSVTTLTAPSTSPRSLPGPVTDIHVRESQRLAASGAPLPGLSVSWTLDADTARYVRWVNVWVRPENGTWELAKVADGAAVYAMIDAPALEPGQVVEVAIQPESISGAKASLEKAAKTRLVLTMATSAPGAPSGLSAVLGADGARYTWTKPSVEEGISYEARRGGWILGQPVFLAPPGHSAFGPTSNWASGIENAAGDAVGTLFLRARDGRGRYSTATTLSGFDTTVLRASEMETQAWEDYGAEGGWYDTGTPGGGGVVNLARTTYAGRKALHFNGSSLTATYTTGLDLMASKFSVTVSERCYVEAWCEAYQEHPLEFGSLGPVGDPDNAQWTPEGPLVLLPGQSNATMTIEMQMYVDGANQGWVPYEPGVYVFQEIRFRVTCTRPADTYDVRIFQLHTRIQRIPRQRRERTPWTRYASGRMNGYG